MTLVNSNGIRLGAGAFLLALMTLSGCAVSPARQPADLRIDASALLTAPVVTAPTLAPVTVPAPVEALPAPAETRADPAPQARRYVWQPNKAKKGPVTVVVSLSDQKAYVYRDGTRIAYSQISTGKRGYETPTGRYRILQKKKEHQSNLYEDGNMPFMQRLTWDGIALHGGRVPNYPASHGCIRFPMQFARKLYGVTDIGSQVVIAEYHPGDELI